MCASFQVCTYASMHACSIMGSSSLKRKFLFKKLKILYLEYLLFGIQDRTTNFVYNDA